MLHKYFLSQKVLSTLHMASSRCAWSDVACVISMRQHVLLVREAHVEREHPQEAMPVLELMATPPTLCEDCVIVGILSPVAAA